MSAITTIKTRRSVREWEQRVAVPREVSDELVDCALSAPSSKNAQPWCLHVVAAWELLDSIALALDTAQGGDAYTPVDPAAGKAWGTYASTVRESASVLRSASLCVFVENLGVFSRSRQVVAAALPEVREDAILGLELEMIGIGAAVENTWLAAIELGLSGVFMGDVMVAESFIKSALNFSGDLVGALALGPAAASDAPPKPLVAGRVVHWDK